VITRRSVLLAGGVGLLLAQGPLRGQPRSQIPRIGILWLGSVDTPAALQNRSAFRQRLAALGYVEGKNIVIDERFAGGNAERLSALARELAASKVDVIVAPGVTAGKRARENGPGSISRRHRPSTNSPDNKFEPGPFSDGQAGAHAVRLHVRTLAGLDHLAAR